MKRSLIIILLCVLAMTQFGFAFSASADTPKEPLKILAVGNSFSVDAMQYLWDIAADGGVPLVLGNLYIGGCTLETHANNIASDSAAYTYYKNTNGVWSSAASTSISTALADEDWDIITVQQASHYSGMPSTYAKLDEILTYLAANAPKAKIYFHMTWAYQGNSTHSGFANYAGDQMTMYNAILSTVSAKVNPEPRIRGVIPSGTAIQNLRSSYIGDTVTRDGYHLSYDLGRYTAALTWYAYFTGQSVRDITYAPSDYAATVNLHRAAVDQAVEGALAHPFEVTTVTAKDPGKLTDADLFESVGKKIAAYEQIDWVRRVGAYYNSANSMTLYSPDNSTASNLPNFIASKIFTAETLPLGSVVILDDGYKYRPEGWVSETSVNSTRPTLTTARVVLIDAGYYETYTFRAFNLSASTARTMTAADAAHLRIYVPRFPNVTLTDGADANGDGLTTVLDALTTLRTVLDGSGNAADMNGDGIATLADVIALLRLLSV